MPHTTEGDDRKKTWRLLLIAIIFALLAGMGTMVYLKVLEHRLEEKLTPAEKQMVQVVVANKDLAVGSKIDTSTMSMRKVPAEYVNSDVITPDKFDSIAGAILTKPLTHGKMLSTDYIDLNIPKDFSGTVQVGHRAVTIQVGEINSVAGLIRPGNFIDLYTQLPGGSAGGPDSGEIVIPVLEDVLVLATDQHSARPNVDEFEHLGTANNRQTYDTLTLEVTPKEAALIAIAESRGSLIATLRNAKDTGGINFSQVGLNDLVQHSGELLREALTKQQNRSLAGIHLDSKGRLVTKDGTIITDPNVHLNKDGQLVTKDGTILSGRDLVVGQDGKIRTKGGKLVDTGSLVAGKNGTLIDKNGTVVNGNGYKAAQGGFLVDKNGHVFTKDGHELSGVTVGPDGKVRTKDGKVLTADAITIGKDGKVYMKADPASGYKVDANGDLVTADGKKVKVKDLVTVGPDGKVRTRDGKVIEGAYVDANGVLRKKDGSVLTARDVVGESAIAGVNEDKGQVLAGVTAKYDPDFAKTIGQAGPEQLAVSVSNRVEYIVGGSTSDGVATTFTIQVEEGVTAEQ